MDKFVGHPNVQFWLKSGEITTELTAVHSGSLDSSNALMGEKKSCVACLIWPLPSEETWLIRFLVSTH